MEQNFGAAYKSTLGRLKLLLLLACPFVFGEAVLAHNKVVVIPLAGDDTRVYKVGDTGPAGGVVFHITDGGRHGLEASHEDQSTAAVWGCNAIDLANLVNLPTVNDLDPNSGAHNSFVIAISCGINSAAGVASNYDGPNGKTAGWYLPNKEELNLLFSNRLAVGGFASDWYISSSEINNAKAWAQDFGNGFREQEFKNLVNRVRAIRAF